VTADVLSAGVAAAVPIEPSHWFNRADFEAVPQDIPGYARPTAPLPTVLPQHGCLSHRRSAPRRPQFTSRISSCAQSAPASPRTKCKAAGVRSLGVSFAANLTLM
jgi:hypothetical protein